MYEISGSNLPRKARRSKQSDGWSQSSFKTCFAALNRLAHIPEPLDRLTFVPFPNAREHARKSGGKPDGRTLNLPIEDAAKLYGLALKWVYKRSEGVIELITIWRTALHEASTHLLHPDNITRDAVKQLRNAYPRIQAKYDLPEGLLMGSAKGNGGLYVNGLIQDLQTAAMTLIGVNQARRKNEVLGEGRRPWGLYRGCIQLSDPFVEAYELDIYIEKTWRAWLRMSANKLTADSVRVLERLRDAIVPDETSTDTSMDSVHTKRSQKLFVMPSHALLRGVTSRIPQYEFENHSAHFYEEAGVSEQLRKTHPNRRIFSLLYMYRWNHPLLQALSEYLCHLDLECTRTYVTDDVMRAEAERIQTLYRIRTDSFPAEELQEARLRYTDDLLQAMLTSSDSGGPMTRRVRQWVRRLAHRVEFAESELDEIFKSVRMDVKKRGYEPMPFRHGACWAGGDRSAKKAHCGNGKTLRRERASISICRSCPFHSTSKEFLHNIEGDALRLEQLGDEALDPENAATYKAQAIELRALIALEMSLMERNLPLKESPGAWDGDVP